MRYLVGTNDIGRQRRALTFAVVCKGGGTQQSFCVLSMDVRCDAWTFRATYLRARRLALSLEPPMALRARAPTARMMNPGTI
jgi:hypothetical protein